MSVKLIELQIKRANKYEVSQGKELKLGVTYYVESVLNPGTFCGPLVTSNYTDLQEFKVWYNQGRIYVPVGSLTNKIKLVEV